MNLPDGSLEHEGDLAPPPFGVLAGVARASGTRSGWTVGGRYRVQASLQEGRELAVYNALDVLTQQQVELTIAEPNAGFQVHHTFRELSGRLAMFRSPRFPECLARGETEDGLPFFASEVVSGVALADIETPLAPERAASLVGQLLDGLSDLHRHGLVHTALDPIRLWVLGSKGDERLKIGGHAALIFESDARLDSGNWSGALDSRFRMPDRTLGTTNARGLDLFAVGVILETLAGVDRVGVPESSPEQSRGTAVFDEVIRGLTTPDLTKRFESAEEAFLSLNQSLERAGLAKVKLRRSDGPIATRPAVHLPPRTRPPAAPAAPPPSGTPSTPAPPVATTTVVTTTVAAASPVVAQETGQTRKLVAALFGLALVGAIVVFLTTDAATSSGSENAEKPASVQTQAGTSLDAPASPREAKTRDITAEDPPADSVVAPPSLEQGDEALEGPGDTAEVSVPSTTKPRKTKRKRRPKIAVEAPAEESVESPVEESVEVPVEAPPVEAPPEAPDPVLAEPAPAAAKGDVFMLPKERGPDETELLAPGSN